MSELKECDCCSAESRAARNDAIVFASQLLMGAARDLLERVELDYSLPRSGIYSRVNHARTWINNASLMLDSLDGLDGNCDEVEVDVEEDEYGQEG